MVLRRGVEQVRSGRDREVEKDLRVPTPKRGLLAGRRQAFDRVFADEHVPAEARLAAIGHGRLEEALVDERFEAVEQVQPERPIRIDHGTRRVGTPAADEHRQPPEQDLLVRIEQVVTPADRRAQVSLALRRVPVASRQEVERRAQAVQDLGRREELAACGGELDGERQARDTARDLGDDAPAIGIGREARHDQARSFHEQRLGIAGGQRRHRVFLFAADPQRFP